MSTSKQYIKSVFILLFSQFLLLANGQKISNKQKQIVHTEALFLLKKYEATLNEIAGSGTSDATKNKYKNEFLELFLNRQILLFNDLEPTYSFSEFYEVENYIANLLLWYPDGLTVNFKHQDLSTFGIVHHKENIYYLDILADKQSAGNFMNREIIDKKDELSMRVAFIIENNRPANFKFVGIRKAGSTTNATSSSLAELNKVEISENERRDIQNNVKILMLDYIRALEFLGSPNEQASDKEYIKADFLTLFESEETTVFNDILPKEDVKDMDIKSYTEAFITEYPKGANNIALNTDSAFISHIEKQGETTFKTTASAKKFFSGEYQNKTAYKIAVDLQFIFEFDKKDGSFTNYRIKSIDKALGEYSDINTVEESATKSKTKLEPVSIKGTSVGAFAGGGMSLVNNMNLSSQSIGENYHEWKLTPGLAYTGGVALTHYTSNKFGFETGIGFTSYETKFNLSGNFTNGETSTDINNIPHTQKIDANYDSTVNLKYLSIPINACYVFRPSQNIKFYMSAGLNISYGISADYKVLGNYRYYGEYEVYPQVAEVIDNPGLNFKNEQNINRSGSADSDKISVMGILSFGIMKRLGYFSYLKVGPILGYDLYHSSSASTYTNVFGYTTNSKPTKITYAGLQIMFLYNL